MSKFLDEKQSRLLSQIIQLTNVKQAENIVRGTVAELSKASGEKIPMKKKGKNPTPPKSNKTSPSINRIPSPSNMHYSGSAFVNSPDPSIIPLPDFEEMNFFNQFIDREVVSFQSNETKSRSLRNLLKIDKSMLISC